MSTTPSLHTFVATLYFKGGGSREIHYDTLACMAHGFWFSREDNTGEFVNAETLDSFEYAKAPELPTTGRA